ncbi:DUF445 domain-containing protein [Selenomonas ruminantium]|uniref:Uncharacterized membrane-anchored protein YjiN, DUF445 family n=1 Tax=Selenomonas ruminantium TaxID=971 RepID=A0A1H3VY77_SELRU|nr:DUF445 domain-containing protein [Selenomonas ruminantium]SDZ79641.1 Uncharacterized membrane-anchored protein YjiN, DUF445 family [Selenomonas ruminantium]
MNKGLNKADKTLIIVFILFLLALGLHLHYPQSILTEALLFASEAALVGGIADWFAVTALFKKPLGFPYHTAILPRRREAFIKASVTLVQKEFFSKRKIFRHLERLHIMPMLLGWLREPANEARLVGQLVDYVRDFLMQQSKAQAGVIAAKMREALAKVEPEDFFALWGKWLQKTGKDKEFVQRIAAYWRGQASTAAARQQIKALLEAYQEEKTGENVFAQLLAGFAQAVDLINYDEAAELIQRQLLAMLDELGTKDSPLQQEMLALFYEKATELNQEPQFHQLTHELKDSLLKELPLETAVVEMFDHLRLHFLEDKARDVDPLAEHLPALRSRLEELISEEYQRMLYLVENDEQLHDTVGGFLFDLLGRSALHAQTLVGVIVTDVLSRLTDEQLNHLVYDKVEPDLLWIRMNGSIVGAGIGLLLFACLQITM